MNVNYTGRECVCVWLLCLQYNGPAIRPTLEGSTLPSMKGCAVRGENGWIRLADGEAKLSWTFAVLLLLDHVFVCLHIRGSFPSGYPPSISSSHTLAAHGGVWEEGEGWRAVALGRRGVRKGFRWDLSSRVWSWCYEALSATQCKRFYYKLFLGLEDKIT